MVEDEEMLKKRRSHAVDKYVAGCLQFDYASNSPMFKKLQRMNACIQNLGS